MKMKKLLRLVTGLALLLSLASCDDVRVYGSVGVSSYGGYHGGGYYGGPRYGSSISVGGRLM
jgi:hypothetical protein